MSKVMKLQKVLVIGSGPIVIGQAAEFDYAGTQACKALREEGINTILVNSNPATIMTDEGVADVVYIEPLTVEVLDRIIDTERPDGILPTLGGQTGLNLAVDLADAGVLDKYNVRLLGTPLEAIRGAEDREMFRRLLADILEPVPPSLTADSMERARKAVSSIGFPLVVRPAYTLGGTGGGIINAESEFEEMVRRGLSASPINQVLLEKSLVGWKEIEYEVVRDSANNCITVCNMENIDPMGVHTGDSIVVAPSQTLSDKEYHMLRTSSLKIIRALGIEGGCNVQFALAPCETVAKTLPNMADNESEYYVIEVNPRVSRSSALASKATGYPIARVASKIAVGKRLDEISNAVTGKTLAAFEPALDYCVVKIPRWPFDKFPNGDRTLGTQMKATGEVMAIDRSFEAAFQKAVRSLEITDRSLLWENDEWAKSSSSDLENIPLDPTDERIWALFAVLRRGMDPESISKETGIDPWFIRAFHRIVIMERRLLSEALNRDLIWKAKRLGFSDQKIGILSDRTADDVRKFRHRFDIRPVYKMVDTCAAEFEAKTPYFYSAYEEENEASPLPSNKALVVGSGPIRIGQGVEFDYCSVHAAWALQQAGIRSVMVNSNPETVSTDFDTSDRLYFEPLDEESILDILENETILTADSEIDVPSTVVQFGGQTAINLSQILDKKGKPILGSTAKSIDIASDRHLFEEFLSRIDIPNPPGAAVADLDQALTVAQEIGYPVLVRPSYVLGGRAMEVVGQERPEVEEEAGIVKYHQDGTPMLAAQAPDLAIEQNATELVKYMTEALAAGQGRRVLIDKYFEGQEVEVDAVCDGEGVLIPGIMEHVERAGVHSGDSLAIYPSLSLSEDEVNTIVDYTTRIGLALDIRGLMNIQYVVVGGSSYRTLGVDNGNDMNQDTKIYVLEVNPRSSRTIPFISKVTGVPMVRLAVNVMLGHSLREQGYKSGLWEKQDLVGVKAPVFSMSKLSGVDTYLGPEMKSTGEVMGIDYDYKSALSKALTAAELVLRSSGTILLSVANRDKADAVTMIADLVKAGCRLYATAGTAAMIQHMGFPVVDVPKRLNEGHPNVLDVIVNGTVDAVINTVTGDRKELQDGFQIRRAAADRRIPCFTSLDTARAAVEILANGPGAYNVKPLDSYRKSPP